MTITVRGRSIGSVSRARIAALMGCIAIAGCQPNPRTEIAAIAEAALAEVSRTAPGQALCVERTIVPWRPAAELMRKDPSPPPGYEGLYGPGVFRGGGGIKGDVVGAMAVRSGASCFDLRGPLVAGDRAMLEVHLPGTGFNLWLRRTDGDWRVVTTTTSVYPS